MTTYTISNRTLRVLQELPFARSISIIPEDLFYYPASYSINFDLIRQICELSGREAIVLQEGAMPLIDFRYSDMGVFRRMVTTFAQTIVEDMADRITPEMAQDIARNTNHPKMGRRQLKRRNDHLLVELNDVTFIHHNVTLVIPPYRFESFDKTLTQAGWKRA